MSTKRQTLDDPNSCLNKAKDNEPIFVLRANDPIAPLVVRIWASLSTHLGPHSVIKTSSALLAAVDMEDWRTIERGQIKIYWRD